MSASRMDLSCGSFAGPMSSSDHALYSPDLSTYTGSPQSTFMYEEDDGIDRGKHRDSVFEFPRPMEINDLGGELNTSFWSEGSLLETSFGDCGKASLWDFSGFDDISSPLQHPEDDLSYSPTLAELNNDDSQSFDAMLSSHNACISSGAPKKKYEGHSNVTGNPVKAECSTAGSTADVVSDTGRETGSASPVHESLMSLDGPSAKPHSAPLSTKLGARPHREKSSKSTNRLTLKTAPAHHPPSKLRKPVGHHRGFPPGLLGPRVDSKRGSLDHKWLEIQSFIHEDSAESQASGRAEAACRTSTSPERKGLMTKDEFDTARVLGSGVIDGYDSHDEGLGSEHEDQEDEDNEGEGLSDVEEEEEEEEDDDDACSDLSEDHGVATTSSSAGDLFPPQVKSRRSEYDDLTPNPKRLLSIGNELHKLNKVISGMIPVSALPPNARNRSRKEKNKLASRACRLKKKAQHEANKVKLYGLEKERDRLMQVIKAIRREIVVYLGQRPKQAPCLLDKLNILIKSILGQMVASHTQEFVSSVLEKAANGSKTSGGLNFLTNHD